MRWPLFNRGRTAQRPQDIPARGWWDIAWRVARRLGSDNVSFVAGGIAMFSLMSVLPAMAAIVLLYGRITTPSDVVEHMKNFAGVLPPGVWDIFNSQLQLLAGRGAGSLTLAASLGLLIALWSARSAMAALMIATNIAYGEREKRGFIGQILLSLLFTAGAIAAFMTMLTLGVVIPFALRMVDVGEPLETAATALRMALLWLLALVGFAIIYRYAPARQRARWHWVTWGSTIAATLWLLASGLFAWYLRAMGRYGWAYGALGGLIALLMWFYISSFIIVLGALINAEMERQTLRDTTVGDEAPLGQRGAYVADTVGPSVGEEDPLPYSGIAPNTGEASTKTLH